MEAGSSALQLLERGIDAMTRANAGEMGLLVNAAASAQWPETRREQRLAREKLNALGALIDLTRLNLRLLRGANTDGWLRD